MSQWGPVTFPVEHGDTFSLHSPCCTRDEAFVCPSFGSQFLPVISRESGGGMQVFPSRSFPMAAVESGVCYMERGVFPKIPKSDLVSNPKEPVVRSWWSNAGK